MDEADENYSQDDLQRMWDEGEPVELGPPPNTQNYPPITTEAIGYVRVWWH